MHHFMKDSYLQLGQECQNDTKYALQNYLIKEFIASFLLSQGSKFKRCQGDDLAGYRPGCNTK